MKRESINVKWMDGMSFEADVDGYKIRMDTDPEFGGRGAGPKPKPLMMVALAGCTGMDMISLMNKMRIEYDSLNIIIEGDITEDHPKHYKKMKIIYELTGSKVDRDKVEKIVKMSQDKYCGVSHSYKQVMDIDYEIRILEK